MFKKLGAGEYPLRTVFWLFGLVGFACFYIITNITHSGVLRMICPHGNLCSRNLVLYALTNFPKLMLGNGSVLGYMVIHIILGAMFVTYMYIVVRSLWKCGATYEGSTFWVFCAKFILVCLLLLSVKSLM